MPHDISVIVGTRPARMRNPAALEVWTTTRQHMEANHEKVTPRGRGRRRWKLFDMALTTLRGVAWIAGKYNAGVRNALDIRTARIEIPFANLPAAFDGYTILHMSDLHLDGVPGLPERLQALVREIAAETPIDLCTMTGDFLYGMGGPFEQIVRPLGALTAAIPARDGVIATLGNHDVAKMAAAFESIGITVLTNETIALRRDDATIQLTGIDDVHYYYTPAADAALRAAPEGFKIVIVHSPELGGCAAVRGFSLYLCGHTHAGQVCLPGGKPVFTHTVTSRKRVAGLWRVGRMVGYTSAGAGCSGQPLRYFSRGEIALITLRRANSGC